ncbi:hypothetical protein BDP27DRAFT_1345030 [Rhodocollybia butyracea]|uniref:LAGLIDADG homing endonuclease n=1 Tax=Rhodocollybia butyracea TaxID=206335 RepID=A0A9P5TXA1_9AGAR|nr:hypothetical protein BDP27DRAFT_1345030 [Rhodocollybia butyracea]
MIHPGKYTELLKCHILVVTSLILTRRCLSADAGIRSHISVDLAQHVLEMLQGRMVLRASDSDRKLDFGARKFVDVIDYLRQNFSRKCNPDKASAHRLNLSISTF